MTALNKQALREAAEKALPAMKRLLMMPNDELFDEALLNVDGDVGAANAFNLIAGPETMLALLDELESGEHQNGYLRNQRDEWECKAISNFEECAEMSARIEELESQRKLAFTVSNRWADKFREAEKRIADQHGIILSARNFISEYAQNGDVGATEFVKILDRATGIGVKGE